MNRANTECLSRTRTKNKEILTTTGQKSFCLVGIPSIQGYCRKKTSHSNALKVLGFFFLLKSESPGAGLIQNYLSQIPQLSKKYGISDRTFYNYLEQLRKFKLAFIEDDKIRLVGWDEFCVKFKASTKIRKEIKFSYGGKNQLNWWRNNL